MWVQHLSIVMFLTYGRFSRSDRAIFVYVPGKAAPSARASLPRTTSSTRTNTRLGKLTSSRRGFLVLGGVHWPEEPAVDRE